MIEYTNHTFISLVIIFMFLLVIAFLLPKPIPKEKWSD